MRRIDLHPWDQSTLNVGSRDRSGRNNVLPRKTYRPEEVIAKLREAEVLLGQGKRVSEVVKAIGISEVSHYRLR
jgi:hypothetical protein